MMTVRPLSPALDRMFSLNRELDRALGSALTNGAGRVWHPATDVIERTNEYLIALELPGVQPDAVEVIFEQNTLTVRGTKTPTVQPVEDAELRICRPSVSAVRSSAASVSRSMSTETQFRRPLRMECCRSPFRRRRLRSPAKSRSIPASLRSPAERRGMWSAADPRSTTCAQPTG